jgi:2-keto-3-deoxy-L-rhamnonate aldolase RhmA
MRTNTLRTILQSGRPTLGTRINSTWPGTIEILGHTGLYDYVEFLGEYASYTLPDLENLCRAAELYNLGTMIKIDQDTRQYLAQRAIGAGFQSVLFADSRGAEDARECVRIVKPDTPEDGGYYGAAGRRFAYVGHIGQPEYVQALRDIVVAIMIEKSSAVDRLEEILSVPGIDLIQWGPADYAMSIGRAGERRSPEVKAVERRVIETCLRMGIAPRVEINAPDDAAYYLDLGVRHFNLSSDLNILFGWWKDNGEKLRKKLEG